MTQRVLTFIRLLRAQGVRVSVAESLDALQGVGCVGVHDRELLRLTLRTALVKAQRDFATFDVLFARFFSLPQRRRKRRGQPQPQPGDGQKPVPQPNGQAMSPPPQDTPPRPLPFPTPAPASPPASPPTAADAEAQAEAEALAHLADLESTWEQHLEEAQKPQHAAAIEAAEQADLRLRLDQLFPPDRLADIYHEMERIVARLLARRALRTRQARRGRVDLRRTVLHGLRQGSEVPFTLVRKRRTISKLRLIVLCDVSGSVWHVSTFLLKLVHTLQGEFANVRSMVFVNSLVEVTELFQRMRFPEDLETLRQYPHLNLFGFSDFGRVFYQFWDEFLGELTRETVLLILGDARNNGFDSQSWVLEDLRQRSHRLIWLHPEPRRDWYTGDAVLADYAPYCAHVLECWTLEHLVHVADVLLRP